jgi:aminomethyltransferase
MGRAALQRRKDNPAHKLVGLDIDSAQAVGHGDGIFAGRAQVGVVTSAMRSPLLGKTIALARIDIHHAQIGTTVEIGKLDGQQKRLAATVGRLPHYDPEKTKPRS